MLRNLISAIVFRGTFQHVECAFISKTNILLSATAGVGTSVPKSSRFQAIRSCSPITISQLDGGQSLSRAYGKSLRHQRQLAKRYFESTDGCLD